MTNSPQSRNRNRYPAGVSVAVYQALSLVTYSAMTWPGGGAAESWMSGPHRTSMSHPSPAAAGRSSSISERNRMPHCS